MESPEFTALPSVPPLAGLCSYEAAARPGLPVEQCVDWIKRHHYLLRQLFQILTARITAEPLFELKSAFSLHAYVCAEHATAFRQRVSELREPPLGLEVVPHPGLEQACAEVGAARTSAALVLGVYGVLIPALIESLEAYRATTNPLADAPTVRATRFCLLELEDLRTFGAAAWTSLTGESLSPELQAWRDELVAALDAAGGLSGRVAAQTDALPPARYSANPWEYDPVPRRDSRFQDPFNGGVNPEAFLYDNRFAARDKVLMMYYKRLREIDVPEMMASILTQTPDKPWKYYRDMSRQVWDEARHALLGDVGFRALGLDWSQIPINFTWSLNLNAQLEPWERHAVLFFIEQGLMPKTGKRFEWEVAQASGIPLAATFQDFDWADEVLHAQIGREWYVKDFGDLNEALQYGDRCWSRVMSHWRRYRDEGLTQHANWWPDLYRTACARWGVQPDPTALAFATTYESTRADLQTIPFESGPG